MSRLKEKNKIKNSQLWTTETYAAMEKLLNTPRYVSVSWKWENVHLLSRCFTENGVHLFTSLWDEEGISAGSCSWACMCVDKLTHWENGPCQCTTVKLTPYGTN